MLNHFNVILSQCLVCVGCGVFELWCFYVNSAPSLFKSLEEKVMESFKKWTTWGCICQLSFNCCMYVKCIFCYRHWSSVHFWQEQICWQCPKQVLDSWGQSTTHCLWRWAHSTCGWWGLVMLFVSLVQDWPIDDLHFAFQRVAGSSHLVITHGASLAWDIQKSSPSPLESKVSSYWSPSRSFCTFT